MYEHMHASCIPSTIPGRLVADSRSRPCTIIMICRFVTAPGSTQVSGMSYYTGLGFEKRVIAVESRPSNLEKEPTLDDSSRLAMIKARH